MSEITEFFNNKTGQALIQQIRRVADSLARISAHLGDIHEEMVVTRQNGEAVPDSFTSENENEPV